MLLYAGDSPEGGWGLVSRLQFPTPVGRRCGINYNGDLLILTVGGLFSVKQSLNNKSIATGAGITKLVQEGLTQASNGTVPNFAWQLVHDETRGHFLINLPNTALLTVSNSTIPNTYNNIETNSLGYLPQDYWGSIVPGKTEQLVMNTATQAWSLFKGWDALCFAIFNKELYYGTHTGIIAKAHSGQSDLGADIPIVVNWANNFMGDKLRVKTFTQVKPLWRINGKLKFGWGINTDYDERTRLSSNTILAGSNSFFWDTYQWGAWKWSTGIKYSKKSYSIRGIGTSGALSLQCYAKNVDVTLSGVFVFFEAGGVL